MVFDCKHMIYIFGIFKEFILLLLLSPFDDIQSYY